MEKEKEMTFWFFAMHFLSTEGFQTMGFELFLEGFQTFTIRDVK